MENIQINGQKIWGPPKGWVGPPPPHGTEVFIKNIPDDVFEDELYYLFSTTGTVYEVRLPVHWTGMNKGYAFVRYTKVSEADEAIEKLHLCMIRQGRQLKVERSLDNTRLFLSSVPNDKTGEEIKSTLLMVVENVKTVYVYPALENPAMFRGYAFVEFLCHRDAAVAKRILTPDILFNLFERKCVAAWANPLPFLNKETLRNINILFMRNIPNNTKSISIRLAVDKLIAPDIVHKVKRLNDYAFLTFKNHDMAERAMFKIKCNPFFLSTKAVHVEWAIPRELASSMSTKPPDIGKDDDSSEVNFEENKVESSQSLLKILECYKNNHKQFITEDYAKRTNVEAENFNNIPFRLHPKRVNLTILQRPTPRTDSPTVKNDALAYSRKTNDVYSPQFNANGMKNDVENQKLLTEFRYADSKDYCRSMHVKNWLQSLTLTDQDSSFSTSPTSPSTSSSTNASWKWDEGCNLFPAGCGTSAGFYGYNLQTSSKPLQQLDMF